jgi:hypothetical protein
MLWESAGTTYPITISVRQLSSGRVKLTCRSRRVPGRHGMLRVRGDTTVPGALHLASTWLRVLGWRVRLRPPRGIYLHVGPTDVSFKSVAAPNGRLRNITCHLRGLSYFPIGERTRLTLEGFSVTVERFSDVADSISGELRIWNCNQGDVQQARRLAVGVCSLLSFASSRPIRIAREYIDDRYSILSSQITDLRGDVLSVTGRPALIFAEDAAAFVRAAIARTLASEYPLVQIMSLIVSARHALTPELAALILANVLEMFRYNFLLGIEVPANRAVLDNGRFRSYPRGPLISFEKALQAFCAHHNIRHWQSTFTDVRNEAVHEGSISGSPRVQRDTVDEIQFFCEYAVLKLLSPEEGIDFVRADQPHSRGGYVQVRNTAGQGY